VCVCARVCVCVCVCVHMHFVRHRKNWLQIKTEVLEKQTLEAN